MKSTSCLALAVLGLQRPMAVSTASAWPKNLRLGRKKNWDEVNKNSILNQTKLYKTGIDQTKAGLLFDIGRFDQNSSLRTSGPVVWRVKTSHVTHQVQDAKRLEVLKKLRDPKFFFFLRNDSESDFGHPFSIFWKFQNSGPCASCSSFVN